MRSFLRLAVLVSAGVCLYAFQVAITDPYPQLIPGTGIMTVLGQDNNGVPQKSIILDTTVEAYVMVGTTVPAACSTTNSVFFQTYTNGSGQITIFSIWLCGPNGKYQKPLLYKQQLAIDESRPANTTSGPRSAMKSRASAASVRMRQPQGRSTVTLTWKSGARHAGSIGRNSLWCEASTSPTKRNWLHATLGKFRV